MILLLLLLLVPDQVLLLPLNVTDAEPIIHSLSKGGIHSGVKRKNKSRTDEQACCYHTTIVNINSKV